MGGSTSAENCVLLPPGCHDRVIAYVFFLYPSRVSSQEAFDVLSLDDGKLSRPVLRGPGLTMGSGYSINRLHPVRT